MQTPSSPFVHSALHIAYVYVVNAPQNSVYRIPGIVASRADIGINNSVVSNVKEGVGLAFDPYPGIENNMEVYLATEGSYSSFLDSLRISGLECSHQLEFASL